jgi:hypothetical protein
VKKGLLITLLLSLVSTVQAADPIKITWQDLQGKIAPFHNPFDELTDDQLYNLSVYGQVVEIEKEFPDKVTDEMREEAAASKAQLIDENIDMDYFFEQRLLLIEKREQAALVTNGLLANRKIEMSGFMLALEFDNGFVTEFLLLPIMGACSHKPVPPANQIILVKAKQAIEAGSPYMPIKVTGTLRITPQEKDLYLVDGQKNIEMSYTLEDTLVEPIISTY